MDTGDAAKGHFESATGSQPNTSNNSIHSVAYHQSDSSKAPIDNVPVTNGESLIIESEQNSSNISVNVAAYHQGDLFKVPTDKIPVMNGVLSPEGPVPGNQPDGLKLLISSPGGSPASEKSRVGQNPEIGRAHV